MSRFSAAVAEAAVFAAAAAGVYLFFVWTTVGQLVDAAVFVVGGPLAASPLAPVVNPLRTGLVVVLALVALVVGTFALLHGRWAVVLTAVGLVGCSVLLARGLRAVLPRPVLGDYAYAYNTLPSGHAAAAASLVAAVVLLGQPRLPPATRAAGTGVVVIAGVASVVTFAHRPSDVVVAVLLVAALDTLARWLARSAAPDPCRRCRNLGITLTVGAAVLVPATLAAPEPLGGVASLAMTVLAVTAAAWWLLLRAAPDPH